MRGTIAIGGVLAATLFAFAAREISGRPAAAADGAIAVAEVDTVAKVLKTDQNKRTVTITDPAGKRVTIQLPPEVALDQIKKGSLLDVRYLDAQALAIGRPGTAPAEEERTVTLAPEGGTSSAVTSTTHRVVGMIKDIDRSKRELTIEGPDRRALTMKVAPGISGFDEAKIGDTAVIDYTEAVAISAAQHSPNGSQPSHL